jgi:predicted outer membrane lipoprotein
MMTTFGQSQLNTYFANANPRLSLRSNLGLKLANAFGVSLLLLANAFGVICPRGAMNAEAERMIERFIWRRLVPLVVVIVLVGAGAIFLLRG